MITNWGWGGGLSLVFLFTIYRLQFTTYKKLITVDSGLHNSDLMPLRCGNPPVCIMLLRNQVSRMTMDNVAGRWILCSPPAVTNPFSAITWTHYRKSMIEECSSSYLPLQLWSDKRIRNSLGAEQRNYWVTKMCCGKLFCQKRFIRVNAQQPCFSENYLRFPWYYSYAMQQRSYLLTHVKYMLLLSERWHLDSAKWSTAIFLQWNQFTRK